MVPDVIVTRSNFPRIFSPLRVLLFVLAFGLLFPAVSGAASTLYVATTGNDAANNCATQGSPCQTIAHAFTQTSSGDTVSVGAGTYAEGQLIVPAGIHLTGANTATTIIAPDPANTVYTPTNAGYNNSILTVPATSGTVEIDHLTLQGPNPNGNNCSSAGTIGDPIRLDYGLLVTGTGNTVNVHDMAVTDIRENPLGNCPGESGNAIEFNSEATGVVSNVTVTGFQAIGIRVNGFATNVEVKNNTVTGTSNQATVVQSGILADSNATANIHDNTITNLSCNSPLCGNDPWTDANATGIRIFGAHPNTQVDTNDISSSGIGLYVRFNANGGTVSNNNIHNNSSAGIMTDGGNENFYFNKIANNNIGIFTAERTGPSLQNSPRYASNNILNNTEGMVYQDDGTVSSPAVTTFANRIVDNATGLTRRGGSTLTYDVTNNWWGCNAGPNNTGCDTTTSTGLDTSKWLVLAIDAPSSGIGGTSSTVNANTWYNNNGDDVKNTLGAIPATPVTFGGTHVTPSPTTADTATGQATTQALLDEQLTTAHVSAKLDNQTVGTDITITGTAPFLDPGLNPVATGDAQSGFSTTDGTWLSIAPITYTYQWQTCVINNLEQTVCTDVPGATRDTFSSTAAMNGKKARACVTATNWVGPSDIACSNGLAITYTAPSNTAIPTVTVAGAALEANPGTWSGDTPIMYTYQWRQCIKQQCEDIPGATAQTFPITSKWNGRSVQVGVTATNGAGSSSANSAITPLHVLTPPSNTRRPSIAGGIQGARTTLYASDGSWAGTHPIHFAHVWLLCNASGASCHSVGTGTTIHPHSSWIGKTVRVQVTATNRGNTPVNRKAGGSATAQSAAQKIVSHNGVAGLRAATGCRKVGSVTTIHLTASGRITTATVTQRGHRLRPVAKKRSAWTYHVALSHHSDQLAVVHAQWNSTSPVRLSQRVWTFTTCHIHRTPKFTG